MDIALESFEIEHIVPIALGGTNALDNLALACRGCNSRKNAKIAAIDPPSKRMTAFFNPRKEEWKNHFKWTDNFRKMDGKTAIGRVTIISLQLNRLGVVNLRRLMVLGKVHPPLDTL